jgi:large subunit ribosomal protein L6
VSRVGKKPINIAPGVKVQKSDAVVTVRGPKGELSATVHPDIGVELQSETILVTRPSDAKNHRALHGLWRALLQNMVTGVTDGYTRKLDLVGVGYRAELRGESLHLLLGFSHPVLFRPPEGVTIEVPATTSIVISGIDKQLVGLVAAKIRSFRPPEPYKGKGLRYEGETVRRKAGKAAVSAKT